MPPSAQKLAGRIERHRRARPREDDRSRRRRKQKAAVQGHHSRRSQRAQRPSATRPKTEFTGIIDKLPLAYNNVPAIFRSLEKKTPGSGGLFSIFVSDLCKGCGECVQVCGDHDALRMTRETEDLNAELTTAQIFSRLLPDTPQKFLGLYNDDDAAGFARSGACAII